MSGQKHIHSPAKHWENLHVNNWVAITDYIDRESPAEANPFEGVMAFGGSRKPLTDGAPLQVKAMSFPFLCLSNGNYRFSIDIRNVHLTVLHPTYVKAMTAISGQSVHTFGGSTVIEESHSEKADPKKQENRNVCPVCGGPLVCRARAGEPFMLECDECRFRGSRGEDQNY